MSITIHERGEWADFPVRYKAWIGPPPKKVIVHHSGGDATWGLDPCTQGAAFMQNLYNYGMNRDGAGTEYNDVLICDDQWWEGFGPTVPGAHCLGIDPATGQKASMSCYGVCVWGDFSNRQLSSVQFASLVEFIQVRQAQGWIAPGATIYGHRDFASTACPANIYVQLPDVQAAVDGGAAPIPTPPTPGGDDMAFVIYESIDEGGNRWAWADFLGLEAGGLCESVVWISGDYKASIEQSGASVEHKRRAPGGYRTMRLEAGMPQGDQQYAWSDQPGVDFRVVT